MLVPPFVQDRLTARVGLWLVALLFVHGGVIEPMLQQLLEAGKQCGSTALMMACEEGNPRVLRALLVAGANKEAKDMVRAGR